MVWFRSRICTAILDAMVYLWKYFRNKFRTLSKNVFFSSLSGKSRIYIFSNFYLRVCHEDHSLRFCITSNSVFTECLEFAWFHHCHDWVRIFPPSHYIVFFVKSFFTEKFTKNSHILKPISSFKNRKFVYFFFSFISYNIFLYIFSVVSTILSFLQIEGFDVKALRAFRVLRPLRLVSGVPSKFWHFLKLYNVCINQYSLLISKINGGIEGETDTFLC